MARQLQPHLLINNRNGLPEDHDTPEQRIGKFQYDRPWESCITICRQWAWKPDDEMKSLKECLQTLVLCAGGDGNFARQAGEGLPAPQAERRGGSGGVKADGCRGELNLDLGSGSVEVADFDAAVGMLRAKKS